MRRRKRSSLWPVRVGNAADIERVIVDFARVPNGGLVLLPDQTTIVHRDLVIELAARHRLPAVYTASYFVVAGGLMSYGIDQVDTFRLAAAYVDRILRGDKPADLPVQAPTRYETAINLKTAKALDLTVPPGLLPGSRRGDRVSKLRRREFITLLGGAAALAVAVHARQPERMRRVGVLMNYAEDAPQSQARLASFREKMQDLGWTSRNVQIEYRWGVADADRNRRNAAELVALAPDVILASATAVTAALLQTTRTMPIVFVNVVDPVGAGFVQSMARPGGNATGFIPFEYGMGGRWLERLKQIAPGVRRVAVLQNPIVASRSGQLGAIEALAPSFSVELSAFSVRDTGEIERTITTFARAPNGGLIIVGAPSLETYHDLIVTLAAQHRLPAVYPYRSYVIGGGLMSYGTDLVEQFRRAAGYVDRILKGEKPADMPVQAPTKYELVINLKTAKALGLEVPPTLLARADEVIE